MGSPPGAVIAPPRTREERAARTADLLAARRDCTDPADRELIVQELVLINRGVAEAVAQRYRDRGVASEDLVQVAYMGLVQAVRRFDADRADNLLTYAVPTIRGEIQRYFRDHGWAIRPTRRVQDLQSAVNRASTDLAQRLGRDATAEEVCAELDITPEEHAEAMAAAGCFQPVSLDRPLGADSGGSLGDLVGEDQSLGAAEARAVLEPVLREMSPRDRRILQLRYVEDRCQREIGQELGVTQAQVSRLLARILADLRSRVDAPGAAGAGGARRRAGLDDLASQIA